MASLSVPAIFRAWLSAQLPLMQGNWQVAIQRRDEQLALEHAYNIHLNRASQILYVDTVPCLQACLDSRRAFSAYDRRDELRFRDHIQYYGDSELPSADLMFNTLTTAYYNCANGRIEQADVDLFISVTRICQEEWVQQRPDVNMTQLHRGVTTAEVSVGQCINILEALEHC